MSEFDVVINFFKQGGVFLYPIALVWIIGLVIGIERFIYVVRVDSGNKRIWATFQPLFQEGKFQEAMELSKDSETVLSQVLRYGLSRITTARRRDDIEKALEESLIEVIPNLERRTHYLSALANIVMLMGLFGTVLGLIHAFAAVAQANPAEKASLLSASISVAMNNTAMGLIAAITLLLMHLYIETKTTTIVDTLEVASVKFLNAIGESLAQNAAAAAAKRPDGGAPGARA
jgi:biopolymer transport protein ExbB/TolQ